MIEPGLRRQSPESGNIRSGGRRLSANWPRISWKRRSGDRSEIKKSRCWQAFPPEGRPVLRRRDWLAGAEGIEPRYGDFEIGCSCCSRGVAKTPCMRIHKRLEILEFREPYGICKVQSSGEKWAIWRRRGGFCRLEVRSSNQKSLLNWGKLPTPSRGEAMAATKLAEGEELGSNLLHVAQSIPGDPGGSHSLKIGRATGTPRSDR